MVKFEKTIERIRRMVSFGDKICTEPILLNTVMLTVMRWTGVALMTRPPCIALATPR